MNKKIYRIGVAAGVILIIAPLLYILASMSPDISYNKNLSSVIMDCGYFVLGLTLLISFILNRKIALSQHFWKLPAGILFILIGSLELLKLPKRIEVSIFVISIIIFIGYAKHKKIL